MTTIAATALLAALGLSGTPTRPAVADDATPAAVPVNDCWSTDNGLPAVTELHLGEDSVDTTTGPVTVPVTARAVDTGGPGPATGVTSIGVFVGVVAKPKIGGDNQIVRLTPSPDGTWTGLVTVPQWGVHEPVWRVHQLYVQDAAGNLRVMTLDQLVAAEMSPELSITSTRDIDEPGVADVTVSPRRVDVRRGARWVQLGVRAVNETSGVRAVTVGQTVLHRVSGTTTDGWWRGRVRVHRFDHAGRYRLTVRVTDAAGFLRVAWWGPLRDHGLPWYYDVRSMPDQRSPRVVTAGLARSAVDVRTGDGSVAVTVRATDRDSGVSTVRAVLRDRSGSWRRSAVLSLRAGTRRDGIWRGALVLPRCQTVAGDYTLEIRVRDRAGQVRTRSGLGRLSVRAADHQAPGWTVSQEFESSRNLAVAFTEPVTGLTQDTLSLRRLSGDPAAVPGAWQCRDDAGAPADCATGPGARRRPT